MCNSRCCWHLRWWWWLLCCCCCCFCHFIIYLWFLALFYIRNGTFCTAHRNSIMMPLGKHQYALDTRYLMNCRNIYKLFVRLSDVFAELEDRFCLCYSIHIFLENYLRIWIKETHWNFSIILSQVNAEYSLSISFLRVNLWHRKSVCEFSTPNQTKSACMPWFRSMLFCYEYGKSPVGMLKHIWYKIKCGSGPTQIWSNSYSFCRAQGRCAAHSISFMCLCSPVC